MRLDDRAHSRGRPREGAMMNTRSGGYSRRDLTSSVFALSFRACKRGREMYKKARPCGLVGTCERACLR